MSDLFPGVILPEQDYGHLQTAIVTVTKNAGLQPEDCMVRKVIQLYETMIVRHGVMLVGPTGGGKTTVLNVSLTSKLAIQTRNRTLSLIIFFLCKSFISELFCMLERLPREVK